MSASISRIRETWEKTFPEAGFEYTFLDDEIDRNYDEYRSQGSMFLFLAILAIGIACLGILGLGSYAADQRSKEIGIRKVLGASVSSIDTLLSREFVILIVVANVIALPLAYFMTNEFLRWFAFRVNIGVGTYATVLGVSIFLALAAAGFQSVKAVVANPVDSMRYE